MTREELWAHYVAQNPSFDGNKLITITPQGIRKMFDTTWHHAVSSTKKTDDYISNFFSTFKKK